MRIVKQMSRDELVEFAAWVQHLVYGRVVEHDEDDVLFYDRRKELAGADLIQALTIHLDYYDLAPTLDTSDQTWLNTYLYLCDGCRKAWELADLDALKADDAKSDGAAVAPAGRSHECGELCQPTRVASLTGETSTQ
jgi:hypothetical protein